MGEARALVLLLSLTMGCAAGAPAVGTPASGVPNAITAHARPVPVRVVSAPEPSAASTPTEPTPPPSVSPPKAPPRSTVRSGGCGFGFSDEADCFGGPRADPDAVAQDAADIKRSFFELSPVPAAGPLAQATLRRVLPAAFRADYDEELERVDCSGGYLDDDGKWFLLHVSYAGIDAALVVLDERGRALFKLRVPNRARVYLGDVLGNETREIILSRIEGNAISRWPTTWVIYRVDGRGRLRQVLEHPKSHSYGSKYKHWIFLNRFDFAVHEQVTIETVLSVRAPGEPPDDFDEYTKSAPMQGETMTFVYDPAQGRFRPKHP